MVECLSQPWPWYVTGPLIGVIIPALLLVGGKMFGVSENLRHICAAVLPQADFFNYDWRKQGAWNLTLIAGAVIGGFIASTWLQDPHPMVIADATRADLARLGITDLSGLAPVSIFSWHGARGSPDLVPGRGDGFLRGGPHRDAPPVPIHLLSERGAA